MAGTVRPFCLGWHPVDPGAGPRSPLLDTPPTPVQGRHDADYRQWRLAVENDERRLLQAHVSGPLWHPVSLPETSRVLPVYGGTPQAIEQVATTLAVSAVETGLAMCRVVNLSGWDLSASLVDVMQGARRNRARFDEVSSRGSTVNLFGSPRSAQLVALLVDALRLSAERSAGRHAQQERHELDRVVRLLRDPVTLERILEAVDVALGATGATSLLSIDEIRDLQDHFATVVSQRRATQDRLTDLHGDLSALRSFSKAPGRSGRTVGAGRTSIRWFDVASGSSTDEVELGRQLVARAILQAFTAPGPEELVVVIGAERLADEVLEELVNAAQRLQKRVALIYTRINEAGQRMLGYGGSSIALFLRMPNPADAKVSSEFLGREYKFVVNGFSIAEGRTRDWSDSYGTSTSRGTTRSLSRTSGGGLTGTAFNFSNSLGTSVSRSFEQGTSTNVTSGGSRSTTNTTSTGRVHEYVVEPEVFQQMPDDLMMIASNGTVVVASCENKLRRSKQTSNQLVIT